MTGPRLVLRVAGVAGAFFARSPLGAGGVSFVVSMTTHRQRSWTGSDTGEARLMSSKGDVEPLRVGVAGEGLALGGAPDGLCGGDRRREHRR